MYAYCIFMCKNIYVYMFIQIERGLHQMLLMIFFIIDILFIHSDNG